VSRWPVRGAVVLLVLAAAFAGWALSLWLRAAPVVDLSADRDAALLAGREHVAQLTTLDYHDVDGGIARWLTVSTGPLRAELAGTSDDTRRALRDGATVATGTVLDAAVSELDPGAGTARLLVSVEITKLKSGAPAATTHNRFLAGLTRTGDGWKVSALDQIPLG
jgi:Mce-associated membrane protein